MRAARTSDFVNTPPLDEEQAQRLWAATTARLQTNARRRRAARRLATAGVLVLVIGAGFAVFKARAPGPTWDGRELETASGPQQLVLADGSHLDLEQQSAVRSCAGAGGDVCVQLDRGVGTFQVTKRAPGHSFFVRAGDVEVRVVGTRFTVVNDELGSEVVVHEGVVEVRVSNGKPRRLTVGQRFASQVTAAAPVATPVAAPPPVPAPAVVAPVVGQPSPNPGWQAKDTADELWQRALGARRGGDVRGQERAYDEFLLRYPADLRWGLAALELGRLRMDVLHDPAGAAQVLERALTNGVQSSLREEALYRLSRSYESLGRTEASLTTCQRYLREYPGGAQARAMSASCAHR